ncbi:hypothetical protein DICVIV_06906 [Dictyocaulus viviparus]|uniref:Uncharacterized protein n=1 Tax=Dictyocaulus viviparus TaxID=29172 RepID=A0A0D8XTC6_DICVI|nr:hypothetical protein DICVIV_06906 [Dictyocaulus viviparus]
MLFGVLGLLITAPFLHACSPLPPGEERKIAFKVDGITLPMEFTYSDQQNVTQNYPKVQVTSNDAIMNLQKYVKKAVSKAIKEVAKERGFEGYVSQIQQQIKTIVYYNPMLCYEMEPEPVIGTTPPTYTSGIGYFCLEKDDTVTKILYDSKTEPVGDIPKEFQSFIVILSIRNFIVSIWDRNTWEITVTKFEKQLRRGDYGPYFRGADVLLI